MIDIRGSVLAKIKKMLRQGMTDRAIELSLGLPPGTIKALRWARKLF